MKIFNNFESVGDIIGLKKTNPKHFGEVSPATEEKDDISTSFGNMLNSALKKVNNSQIEYTQLAQKMITSPNEVNPHEVTEAMAKAQFSLSFTKAIRDRVIHAYQEIMNMR